MAKDLKVKADGEDIMQIDGNISLCEIEAVEKEKEKPVVENCWKTWGEETVMCWTNGPLPSNGDLDFVWRKPKCYAIDIGKVAENKLKVTLLMGEGYIPGTIICGKKKIGLRGASSWKECYSCVCLVFLGDLLFLDEHSYIYLLL